MNIERDQFFGGGGRTRLVRTVRLGSPRGSCGNLDVRARFFPHGTHPGRYTVIFDANRRYVPASTGRALGVFSVALRRPLVVAIGNVALGETTAEVRRTLGRPLSVKAPGRGASCNTTDSGGSPELVYRYPGRLTIGFERLGPDDPCTPPLTFAWTASARPARAIDSRTAYIRAPAIGRSGARSMSSVTLPTDSAPSIISTDGAEAPACCQK